MPFSTIFEVLPQHQTLRTVVLMRAVALLCLSLMLALATLWLHIALPLWQIASVILLLAAFNGWTWRRMRQSQPVGDDAVFVQLLVDICALSAMLYFSGGATNPFVSFFLPDLAVAAALLTWRPALFLAGLAIAAYSLLTAFFVPLRLDDPDRAISYHLAGMWANFSVSAALIVCFVAGLSRTVRQRDAQLAQARERYLENDRLLALGMQAANAAHEIGTPLSTVAIIANELLHESDGAGRDHALAPYREDFATIETQIALCKAALDRMGKADGKSDENQETVAAHAWLTQFADQWRLRYPAARLELALADSDARIAGSVALAQILTTLLDNAAQAVAASDAGIRLALRVERRLAVIEVADQGPGIAPQTLKRLGFEPIQSKLSGRGIGLFLAFATARRIGAGIELISNPGSGTRAHVAVPIV
jgi:two-component system sensor histidine kinase RegB